MSSTGSECSSTRTLRKRSSERSRAAFRELVRRRAEGAPVAYLVGRKEFYSLAFAVSPAVLIPRPESEFVVVEYLAQTRHLESPRAVDVGTGSGCLAIASAHHQPAARFVAIDISEQALAVARRNAAQLGVADRIDFRLGDQPRAGRRRRARSTRSSPIPPTSPASDIEHLEPGVRDYEPRTALDGGPGGLRDGCPADRGIGRALEAGRTPDPRNRHRPGKARPRR